MKLVELEILGPDYRVSDEGQVISLNYHNTKEPVALVGVVTRGGYHSVILNTRRHFRVHRLVALAFIPNPDNLPQVNHIDGNKLNNNVNNLEWCTSRHNIQHAQSLGLKKPLTREQHGNSKLTSSQTVDIVNRVKSGESQVSIAREYGVSKSLVCMLVKGKRKVG